MKIQKPHFSNENSEMQTTASPSYEQIAERLGVQPNSVGPTRRRCLDLLLKDLQETAQDLF